MTLLRVSYFYSFTSPDCNLFALRNYILCHILFKDVDRYKVHFSNTILLVFLSYDQNLSRYLDYLKISKCIDNVVLGCLL